MIELAIDNNADTASESVEATGREDSEPSRRMAEHIGGDTILIALDQLVASPDNVRTLRPKKDPDDARLVESIRAQGVIQNLIVIESLDHKGQYEVVAGERRRLALLHLASDGAIALDTPVRCVVRQRADAVAVSLAENEIRKAMHAADRHAAYARLVKDGATESDVARQHGITVAEVRQVLRLSELAPSLLKQFRADKMSFDTALAFASTPDQKRQRAIYKELGSLPSIQPWAVKNAIRQTRVASDAPAARFVGLDAYTEAGGRTEDDLFEGTTHLVDLPILSRLVDERLAHEASLLSGWKWVDTAYPNETSVHRFSRLAKSVVDVPEALASELDALNAKEKALDAVGCDDETDEHYEEYDRVIARIGDIKSIIDSDHSQYDEAEMLHAGCIVSFHPASGALAVYKGLQRPEDRRARQKAQADCGEDDVPFAEQAPPKASGSFARDVGLYRRAAVRATLASSPDAAISLLHFHLCVSAFGGYSARSDVLSIRGDTVSDETSRADIEQVPARVHLNEIVESLDLSWIEAEDDDARYEAFQALSRARRDALVACATAHWLVSGDNVLNGDVPAKVLTELSVDFPAQWRPTRANYFERLKKIELIELGVEWHGEDFRIQHKKSSKRVLVEHFARIFEADPETLGTMERALHESWTPDCMS